MGVPLIRPNPPRLSEAAEQLKDIEDRGIFSNFGPINTLFEDDMRNQIFGGTGACMTVCNATIGLMLAIQNASGPRRDGRRFALMPSFTFAATAHAAMWCGLTPLLCDIDPDDWAASERSEMAMLQKYRDQIAVIVPYATFGYDIDLARYDLITQRFGVPVVVDAAASLGTIQRDGRGFGSGFAGTIVYSMHATKSFATGEGGLVYSADPNQIRTLRTMCNFGFGEPRTATMAGLNGKLTEAGALLGRLKLKGYDAAVDHRAALVHRYRQYLPELTFQTLRATRQAHQFAPALLPADVAPQRAAIQAGMTAASIGTASYFSPHLAEQAYFKANAVCERLPVTEEVAGRMISLPVYDAMDMQAVKTVATALRRQIAIIRAQHAPKRLPNRAQDDTAAVPAIATPVLPAIAAAAPRSV